MSRADDDICHESGGVGVTIGSRASGLAMSVTSGNPLAKAGCTVRRRGRARVGVAAGAPGDGGRAGIVSQRQRSGPGNVPVELTSFVGRDRELAEVKRLLAAARVVTLTGPGGIGKSRLALRAAHQLGRYFPDGVWLAELAELDSPDHVPYALARAMGVHERPEDSIVDTLVAHLRDRRVLLILDN